MKIFAKIMAALAAFFSLCSLVAVWVYPFVRPAIMDFLFGIELAYAEFGLNVLPLSQTLSCLTLLACSLLLLFLVGRKKGGPAIEIALLVFMFLCLPVLHFVYEYLCYYIKEAIDLFYHSNRMADEILLSLLERMFSWNGLYYSLYNHYPFYSPYYISLAPVLYYLPMAGANVAQLLLYVVGGIGVGLAVKNKKQN